MFDILNKFHIEGKQDLSEDIRKKSGWVSRLKNGLARTAGALSGFFSKEGKIYDGMYEDLEATLIAADVGMDATYFLLANLKRQVKEQRLTEMSQIKLALSYCLVDLLKPFSKTIETGLNKPFVIMVVGVNGVGKTTSIGKLAKYFQEQGKTVLLAAGDTFRAAAREQLTEWGARNGVAVIASQSADPAAIIFDAVQAAQARSIDVVLADTAGRLSTQVGLMEEIKKIKRVINKALPGAPHEVLLVLDANTGQNALNQVRAFDDALTLTGLVLTKLDGTAKGGVIAAIVKKHPIPLRFVGVGEGLDDLRPFVAEDFVSALLGLNE